MHKNKDHHIILSSRFLGHEQCTTCRALNVDDKYTEVMWMLHGSPTPTETFGGERTHLCSKPLFSPSLSTRFLLMSIAREVGFSPSTDFPSPAIPIPSCKRMHVFRQLFLRQAFPCRRNLAHKLMRCPTQAYTVLSRHSFTTRH